MVAIAKDISTVGTNITPIMECRRMLDRYLRRDGGRDGRISRRDPEESGQYHSRRIGADMARECDERCLCHSKQELKDQTKTLKKTQR
jgi:hypothetical protein